MLDDITATVEDLIREEARFFHTDANLCEDCLGWGYAVPEG